MTTHNFMVIDDPIPSEEAPRERKEVIKHVGLFRIGGGYKPLAIHPLSAGIFEIIHQRSLPRAKFPVENDGEQAP